MTDIIAPSGPGPRTAYAESTIAAPPPVVWDVLLDFAGYNAWNPFTYDLDVPEVAVGARMRLSARMSDSFIRRQVEVLRVIEPPHVLAWSFPPSPIGHAIRYQLLTETPAGHTRYQTWETFGGGLALIVRFRLLAQVQRGFEDAAQALKAHIESR